MALTQVQGAMVGPTGFANLSGITFPATQVPSADANTLDDYEEGTWTPTVIGSGTAGTTTYTSRTARYTKVGNLVTVSCNVNWSSATGTGDMLVGGLPFTSVSGNINPNGNVMMANIDLPNGTANITTYVFSSDTRFYFYSTLDNTTWQPIQIDASGEFYLTLTYFAA
jgi:hypothetical protein